jgi:hypothetical protein
MQAVEIKPINSSDPLTDELLSNLEIMDRRFGSESVANFLAAQLIARFAKATEDSPSNENSILIKDNDTVFKLTNYIGDSKETLRQQLLLQASLAFEENITPPRLVELLSFGKQYEHNLNDEQKLRNEMILSHVDEYDRKLNLNDLPLLLKGGQHFLSGIGSIMGSMDQKDIGERLKHVQNLNSACSAASKLQAKTAVDDLNLPPELKSLILELRNKIKNVI